jgi:hypothetical protein
VLTLYGDEPLVGSPGTRKGRTQFLDAHILPTLYNAN